MTHIARIPPAPVTGAGLLFEPCAPEPGFDADGQPGYRVGHWFVPGLPGIYREAFVPLVTRALRPGHFTPANRIRR